MRGKPVCAALLSAALLLGLTGCHGSKETVSFQVPDTFDESRTYEITFWAKNDTNKRQTDIYKQAIADFQELYPNIKVELRLYTDYGKIYNDVITNISTGTTPNVCITYPDHIATYLTGENVVVPLDELFADPDYGLGGSALKFDGPTQEEIIPPVSGRVRSERDLLRRALHALHRGLLHQQDLRGEAGLHPAGDPHLGLYLGGIGGGRQAGRPGQLPSQRSEGDDPLHLQVHRQHDDPDAPAAGGGLLHQQRRHPALQRHHQGAAVHHRPACGDPGAFSTFKISSYPANFLNAGQCVFAIDSTAGSTWMGADAPLSDISPDAFVDFETAVMPIPQFDPENPQMVSQGPSICIFNKEDSQEVLASWLFAQYLLTNDVQIAYSQTEGYVPVTTKAQNDPGYQDYLSRAGEDNSTYYDVKLAAVQLLLDNLDNTFVTPVFNGSASLRDAAGSLIESVTKSVRRSQPVDEGTIAQLYEDTVACTTWTRPPPPRARPTWAPCPPPPWSCWRRWP